MPETKGVINGNVEGDRKPLGDFGWLQGPQLGKPSS